MAYSLLTHTTAGSTGGNGFTTSSIDTTGAEFIVVVVNRHGPNSAPTLSDSKSNTWTGLTEQATSDAAATRIFYAKNATVGTGHTFTITNTADLSYASVALASFSGSHLTSPFDVQNGAAFNTSATSINTGSVTPSEDNELLVYSVGQDDVLGASVDIGAITDQTSYLGGGHYTVALGYQIQTTATARNPLWSWTVSSNRRTAAIATFKQAAASSFTFFPFTQPDPAALLRKAEMLGY